MNARKFFIVGIKHINNAHNQVRVTFFEGILPKSSVKIEVAALEGEKVNSTIHFYGFSAMEYCNQFENE